MKLTKLKLANIKPYENNPRRNDEAVKAVVESIKQCSYITPIIVDEDHVILAGHSRYKAMQELGVESAEVLVCEGLTEEQKKKYRFLDNKTGEKATWDLFKLEDELEGLDLGDFSYFPKVEVLEEDTANTARITENKEFAVEVFEDGEFKYQCPKCGFKFN